MSDPIQGMRAGAPWLAWLVPVAVAGMTLAAVISYVRSAEPPVAGGAPLYGKAVHEALEGLKNPGAPKVPAARPALPAGLAPDDYYWCEQCKAYHKRQPAQGQPAGVVPPPVGGAAPVTPAAPPDGTIPPLPAGLSAADYYWCTNCKAYHKRQPGQDPPAGEAQPPAAGTIPPLLAAPSDGVIPPLPAGLSAADYYWCPNCKAYHQRQPAPPTPSTGTPPAPAAPVAPAPPPTAPPAAPATQPAPATHLSETTAPPAAPEAAPAVSPPAPEQTPEAAP